MPAFYTHYTIARETLQSFSIQTKTVIRPFLNLYFFGAQGADFCFFYRFLNPKTPNFGSYLHRHGGYPTIRIMQTFSARHPDLLAYSLGYLTHYATDLTFHPFVYAMTGKSHVQHSRLENTLDNYLKQHAPSNDPYLYFSKNPDRKALDELFFLYALIAVKHGFPPLSKSAFLRAISLFNAYMSIPSAIFQKNKQTLVTLLNEKKRTWCYPADPSIVSTDGCNELLQKSIILSRHLTNIFFTSVQNKTALPRAPFHKNFLTGLPLN